MVNNPPNPAVTVTQAMRRARVSQALRAIEEGARLDDLTDDEIDTIIDAARDHRQSIPAAGVGEGLREAAAKYALICDKLADQVPVAGEPDELWWERQAALREAAVLLDRLSTPDALLLGGDAMRGEG